VIAAHLAHPGRVLSLRLVRTPGPLPRAEVTAAPHTNPHALARVRRLVERINRAAGFPEPR
jgi:3-hydroxyacyl-CoA dehydrogenase